MRLKRLSLPNGLFDPSAVLVADRGEEGGLVADVGAIGTDGAGFAGKGRLAVSLGVEPLLAMAARGQMSETPSSGRTK